MQLTYRTLAVETSLEKSNFLVYDKFQRNFFCKLPIASRTGNFTRKIELRVCRAPVVDGYVMDMFPLKKLATGNFNKVPILLGTNLNEDSLFLCPKCNIEASICSMNRQ